MTKRQTKKKGNVSRLLVPGWTNMNVTTYRLWDRIGDLWEREFEAEGLDQPSAERLFFDPNVQVAISDGAGSLRWVEPADRKRTWEAELKDRSFSPNWKPPRGAPGTLPFQALEFAKDQRRLLLFFDYD